MQDESLSESAQYIERRLATILCADVAGYSKMMAANEERTVRVFRGHWEVFESLVKLHRGRVFNTAGDAILAEFNSAVEAVRCATEIQAALRTRNDHLAPEEKVQFRIGINLGDVIIQGGDLLGDGVNVAARIQTATAPGGICISGSVHDQIQNKLSLDFKLLGEQTYKNIAKPVRTYTINENGGAAVTAPARQKGRRVMAAFCAAVMMIAGATYWGYQQYDIHRSERVRVDAGLAAELAAQKQATEREQRAVEEAKREAQLLAQKLTVEEERRRAQEERTQIEQERKRLEVDRRTVKTDNRQAADEALRRAQEERTQLELERNRLTAERQVIEAARKQAEVSQHAAPTPAKDVPEIHALYDGSYIGRLCYEVPNKASFSFCWPAPLTVRNGIVEGSWLNAWKNTSTARGTVAADGSVQLNLATSTSSGAPVEVVLRGRASEGSISASGQWSAGRGVAGDWKRTP